MASKDKGNKSQKKPAKKNLKEKRQAKQLKKGQTETQGHRVDGLQ